MSRAAIASCRAWLGLLLLGWSLSAASAATGSAASGPAERAACREATQLLAELRGEVAQLGAWNDSLDALTRGSRIRCARSGFRASSFAIERLAADFLFVYAAIVIHVTMSGDELIEVTALSGGLVRAALKTGFDMGFVERANDGRYRIVPVWYPTVVGLLKRKNMLHE